MVKALWAFFLLGVALFFFYDVLRFWRSVWGSRRATFLADVLWWLVAAFSCYTLFLAYTDGVIRALCLVVCGGGFACGYFTLGTLTGHLWARLGKRLAGKRNNRRKKRKILQEKAKKLLSADENHLLTEKDMAAILLSDQGLRKDVGDRRYIAVLNQCDDSTVRKSAEQVGEMLINSTGQNSETIEKIVFAKLQ